MDDVVFIDQIAVQTVIDRTLGSAIGDMTQSGGLAAAFDGTLSQNSAAACRSANVNHSPSVVGKNWGSGVTKTVTGFRVYGATDSFGIVENNESTTITLYGSTDNFASSNVSLGSVTVPVPAASIQVDKLDGLITTTAYQYHRLQFVGTGSYGKPMAAEVQFFEDI